MGSDLTFFLCFILYHLNKYMIITWSCRIISGLCVIMQNCLESFIILMNIVELSRVMQEHDSEHWTKEIRLWTVGCPVLHILQQIIMPLWELILYAIILSLIDFQSFYRRFTIRKSRIQYTKDFQKRKCHFI